MADANVWGTVAETAVGVGSAVMASNAASEQEDYMQQLVNQGSENRDLIESVDRYFLGGGNASKLDIPGFSEQFGQLDYYREQSEAQIDQEYRNSLQNIEDTMPAGGSKMRALAELSLQAQDAKNRVNQEYEAKKNDLDVQLTNQYLQGAMGRQNGVSLNTQYAAGMQGLGQTQNQLASIGSSLGQLAGSIGKEDKGLLKYYEATKPVPASGTLQGADYEDIYDSMDWTIE